MKTTVSEKGQITIPKALRVRLGLGKGQVLEVNEHKGTVVLAKRSSADPIGELYGILKLDRRTDEIMDELRGGEKPA
ncbi:MAG: AbrB/MazE/SpoVT family DNA-binding domain-containing protein [Terriglobia bacterium]